MQVKQYDNHKIIKLEDRNYVQKISDKPSGFWFTNDSQYNWKNFCESEGFRLDSLKFENKFNISNNAKILTINTLEEFDDFNKKYNSKNNRYGYIDWSEISKEYDGIFITDYFWERRLDDKCF